MEPKKKLERIGALWEKISKDGSLYMSGVIKIADKDYKILVFKNNKKTSDKQPAWGINTEEETGNTPYQSPESVFR